ncbi:hypothetical protein A2714_04040 [Candidatus Woesebacteria bacterium RIFCSPHIGHO2_01_FULL_38_9]|uniref:Uncharacterized protein n=2 Tax=Candidatus Woeseibacteriota TaxID=1752722 RepID=A0A1F7XZS7_9BACT|nr:MAG: hypothetical protein A2714_04040 [Candidatus Woesebacteria bacterium RIFCSPHIGHO2_01_FULL_38_9]OGM60081.1 MAG: hypothetical protein A3A75_01605 [Candidatus Woesebacteria bacterium RIFCSPLOWO2_01_FULL_39_10]
MKDKEKKIAKEVAEVVIDYLEKNGVASALPMVLDLLRKKSAQNSVYIYTPRELKKDERLSLKKMFTKLTDTNVDKFSFVKDESLLDGVKIMYKDRVWDFSLSGQLKSLKQSQNV